MYTNQIICGDSAHVLSRLPGDIVDLIVTDPPYLCRYRDRDERTLANDDRPEAVLSVFYEAYRILKPNSYCISFYGWNAIADFALGSEDAGFATVSHIVWPKPYASSQRHTRYWRESAFVLAKGFPKPPEDPINDVQSWECTGSRSHPTEKAVSVIAPLAQSFSQTSDLVLDPILGSGTTAVAAALKGRDYSGIALEQKYCDTARKRLVIRPDMAPLNAAKLDEIMACLAEKRDARGAISAGNGPFFIYHLTIFTC